MAINAQAALMAALMSAHANTPAPNPQQNPAFIHQMIAGLASHLSNSRLPLGQARVTGGFPQPPVLPMFHPRALYGDNTTPNDPNNMDNAYFGHLMQVPYSGTRALPGVNVA